MGLRKSAPLDNLQPSCCKHIDKALEVRLAGNEKFKSGDLIGALRDYHTVLLSLRGLSGKMQQFFGPQHIPEPVLPPAKSGPKIQEISGEKNEPEKQEKKVENKSIYDIVNDALLNTLINSAAIHVKLEHWQRALECALGAQQIDDTNSKASFREAQARIGLGQIARGKAILQEIQQNLGPDPGISRTLAKLELEEKEKAKARDAQFRGLFNQTKLSGRPPSDSSTQAQAGGSDSSGNTKSASAPSPAPPTTKTTTSSLPPPVLDTKLSTSSTASTDSSSGSTVKEKSDQVSKEAEKVTKQIKEEIEASKNVSKEAQAVAAQVKAEIAQEQEKEEKEKA
ncbi:hypothetical protein JCM16303_003767 [Sporobolomyces ruberrimus]